jgi:hypothetical protein
MIWRSENLMTLLGIQPQLLNHPACNLVNVPTELPHHGVAHTIRKINGAIEIFPYVEEPSLIILLHILTCTVSTDRKRYTFMLHQKSVCAQV